MKSGHCRQTVATVGGDGELHAEDETAGNRSIESKGEAIKLDRIRTSTNLFQQNRSMKEVHKWFVARKHIYHGMKESSFSVSSSVISFQAAQKNKHGGSCQRNHLSFPRQTQLALLLKVSKPDGHQGEEIDFEELKMQSIPSQYFKVVECFGEIVWMVKAKEEIVAGMMHHLSLEIIEAGKKEIYEAKLWVKPWLNFKELQELKFTVDDDLPLFPLILAVQGYDRVPLHIYNNASGWREVSRDDLEVQHIS
ncbi:hypothetical protein Bca4012_056881 [Brassica carinata]